MVNRINAVLSDRIIANSRAGLEAAGFHENGKYSVLPNGFDISQFSSCEFKRNNCKTPKIAMVANFTAAKDYHSLIRGAIPLLESGYKFQLMFIGDGPERECVEQSIPDKYKKCFNFTGYLPKRKS